MGKIYTVVLNSQISQTITTAIAYESFYNDWSMIPEGRFKVGFTFTSAQGTVVPPNTSCVNVYIDLGQGANVEIASSSLSNQGATYPGLFLGSLELRSITNVANGLSFFYAGTTTNYPIYIDNRPRNNLITVAMATNGASPTYLTSTLMGQYTLILSLEQQ